MQSINVWLNIIKTYKIANDIEHHPKSVLYFAPSWCYRACQTSFTALWPRWRSREAVYRMGAKSAAYPEDRLTTETDAVKMIEDTDSAKMNLFELGDFVMLCSKLDPFLKQLWGCLSEGRRGSVQLCRHFCFMVHRKFHSEFYNTALQK